MHLFDLPRGAEASDETTDGGLVTAEDTSNQFMCQSLFLDQPYRDATLVRTEVLAAHGRQENEKRGRREEGTSEPRHTEP